MNDTIRSFLRQEALRRFLKYVTIDTKSDPESGTHPSTENQWDLARLLEAELIELGLESVCISSTCFVYGTLPTNAENTNAPAITFCAHMDTSSSVSGKGVVPRVIENYDGSDIRFPDDPQLVLTTKESPTLLSFVGDNLITASGKTLLGADDKAGIAEIMAVLAAFRKFPELNHPDLKIVFTPDEEIGEGVDGIDLEKLAKIAFTMDGGMTGEYDVECFDAIGATIRFHGVNVHPGASKNRMVNAAAIACRFLADLPESQTPEHTENKEGFYHISKISGDESLTEAILIIRDFDHGINLQRVDYLTKLVAAFHSRYPGLKIDLEIKEQYRNMKEILDQQPDIVEKLDQAIAMTGLTPKAAAIRGGTDGARLSYMGVPTPNIFTGGQLYHSKKEWIAESALQKAAEVIVNLCQLFQK